MKLSPVNCTPQGTYIFGWEFERGPGVICFNDRTVEYLAKDTRNDRFQTLRFSTERFLHILKLHVPDAGRHGMRYFGLLAPRSITRTLAAVFMLLGQKRRPKPGRLDWASLRLKCFGKDPLVDDRGERMHWVGRLSPQVA
jgi:hypothetical protein